MRSLKQKFIFLLVSLLLTSLIFPAVTVFADPPGSMASRFTPEELAKSYVYYGALSKCFKERQLKDDVGFTLKEESAKSGNWLGTGAGSYEDPDIGYFLTGVGTSVKINGDSVECDGDDGDSDWMLDAINLWGYNDAIEALCDFGVVRKNGSDCIIGSGDFKGNFDGLFIPDSFINYEGFQNAIKTKVYRGQDPYLSSEATYVLQRSAFYVGCLGSANPPIYSGSVSDDFVYSISTVDTGGKITPDVKFYGVLEKTDKIKYMVSTSSLSNVSMTCGDLANSMENYVEGYSQYIKDLLDAGGTPPALGGSTGTGATVTPTCGSIITTGLGWIVCPIINTLTTLTDGMWGFAENLLLTNPLSNSDGVYGGWKTLRDISNVVFVMMFLIIIFSQLTGLGVTNYGVKKTLPRIVIAAILINLSFILMQIAVDVTNIVGKGLYEAIYNSTTTPTINWTTALELVMEVGIGTGLAAGAAAVAVVAMDVVPALLALLPILLTVLVAFFTAVFTLLIRQALIPIVAMLSPLAFTAYLLPNTEQWFKRWFKLLINLLMLYPMAALVFAGARFAGYAIIGDAGAAIRNRDTLNIIIGLVVMALPLFSLPFLSRQGAPMLAKVSGALNNFGKRVTAPASDFSKELSKNAKVRADNAAMNNQNPGRFTGLRQRYLRFGVRRKAINQNQQAELTRSQTDYLAGEVLSDNSRLAQQMAAGGGSGADSRAQASAIKAQDDIHRQERDAETILLRNKDMATILKQAQGGAGITEAQQDAAMDHVMRNGDLGQRMEAISALTTSASERVRATAADGFFARKDHQVFGAPLGETIRAGGDGAKSVRQAVTDALDKKVSGGNLSAAALASDERLVDEILGNAEKGIKSRLAELELSEDAVDNLAQQARAALESPNTSENLNAEYRAKLQAIADRASKLPS